MKCVKCTSETGLSEQSVYKFYYGRRLGTRIEHHLLSPGETTITTFQIGGSESGCFCERCVATIAHDRLKMMDILTTSLTLFGIMLFMGLGLFLGFGTSVREWVDIKTYVGKWEIWLLFGFAAISLALLVWWKTRVREANKQFQMGSEGNLRTLYDLAGRPDVNELCRSAITIRRADYKRRGWDTCFIPEEYSKWIP